MSDILKDNCIEIIAGDDFTLNVFFTFDSERAMFDEGDTAEMLIHGNDEEKVIHAKQIEKNTASFYLSSDFTQELLKDGESESCYEYCVRVNYASRGRHTPIHRKSLTVKRC